MTTIGHDSKRSNSLSYFYWTYPAFHLFIPRVVSCMSAYWLWNRDQRQMHGGYGMQSIDQNRMQIGRRTIN